jgi:hypothetical protein
MSDSYSDCGLDLSRPVEKVAPRISMSDTGLDVPVRAVRKSVERRIESSVTQRTVQAGSLNDNGLFRASGQPEHVENDLLKVTGLESDSEFYERQVRKAVEAKVKSDGIVARYDRNQMPDDENWRSDLVKSLCQGNVEQTMRKLLARVKHLLNNEERKRAEGAIKALDISLFCDLCERTWGRSPTEKDFSSGRVVTTGRAASKNLVVS